MAMLTELMGKAEFIIAYDVNLLKSVTSLDIFCKGISTANFLLAAIINFDHKVNERM